VTICAKGMKQVFGEIIDGDMHLNEIGKTVQNCWYDLEARFQDIALDAFTIMPNHIHGIICIVGAQFIAPGESGLMNQTPTCKSPALGEIIRAFKAVCAYQIHKNISIKFSWQRNYYEHIVRNEESLNKIREYIINNPERWFLDRENPDRKGEDEFDSWLATFKKRPDQ